MNISGVSVTIPQHDNVIEESFSPRSQVGMGRELCGMSRDCLEAHRVMETVLDISARPCAGTFEETEGYEAEAGSISLL